MPAHSTVQPDGQFAALRAEMVERQLRQRGIRDPRVLAAMGKVPREQFVRAEDRGRAYVDGALPIGFGQTISQPYMVAATCELLGLSGDENVLDVGTGSGYAAAVLAELGASVTTIERLPELAEHARDSLSAAGYPAVEVFVGDGSLGVPERGAVSRHLRRGSRPATAGEPLRAAPPRRPPRRSDRIAEQTSVSS